jgi:hypothetical protein
MHAARRLLTQRYGASRGGSADWAAHAWLVAAKPSGGRSSRGTPYEGIFIVEDEGVDEPTYLVFLRTEADDEYVDEPLRVEVRKGHFKEEFSAEEAVRFAEQKAREMWPGQSHRRR